MAVTQSNDMVYNYLIWRGPIIFFSGLKIKLFFDASSVDIVNGPKGDTILTSINKRNEIAHI